MESEEQLRKWKHEHDRLFREFPADARVVYLASCYRSGRGEYGVRQHVEAAALVARRIWKLGVVCLCPVMNTAHFGGIDIPDDVWLVGDLQLVHRCDAVVMHPNWEESSGAQAERDFAIRLGLPVFYLGDEHGWRKLAAWGKKRDGQISA